MKYLSHLPAVLTAALTLIAASAVSAQTVSGSFEKETAAKGSTVKGTIVLSLPAELHVNSNKPNSEYAIPTSIRLSAPGIKIGEIEYPEGKNKKFQFSETELNVYDGDTSFPFTVSLPRDFRGSKVNVKAVIRFQACTDEVCYPPKNKEIVLTVSVR